MFDKFSLLPSRTQTILLLSGLTAIVILGATLAVLVISRDNPQEAQEQHEAAVSEAQSLADQKQQNQAIERLKTHLADTDNPEYRYISMTYIATFYMQQENYAEALGWYGQAQQINNDDLAAAKGIALAAEAQGDNKTAVAAYKKVVVILEKFRGQGYVNSDIKLYKYKINQLEKEL